MKKVLSAVLSLLVSAFRSRLHLEMEILALRHQLAVYQRSVKRARLKPADRIFWAWLSRLWSGWRSSLTIVQPQTCREFGLSHKEHRSFPATSGL